MNSSVLRFAHRLFLWLGVAILVYAAGTAAYAVVYQRYQSWKFERALITAAERNLERGRVSAIARNLERGRVSAIARNIERGRVSAIARNIEHDAAAPEVVKAAIAEEAAGLREGDVVGKLEVPRIGISVMVLQGIANDTLIVGAGHVRGTPLPGADGNVAIAAHRDTFFRKLEGVLVGDSIQFVSTRGTYEYVVDSTETVDPEDTQVMESRARPELTLITCYPFYFVGAAPKRFIVHAQPSSDKGLGMQRPTRSPSVIARSLKR